MQRSSFKGVGGCSDDSGDERHSPPVRVVLFH